MPTTAPRTANGRATRRRIVAAATELVAERGVAHTSLDDVRARAKASKSQLYLYFVDRDALLSEVASLASDIVLDRQKDVLAGFDSLAGIERYLDAYVEAQQRREFPAGCPIGSLAGQLANYNEQARLNLAEGFQRWEAGFRVGLQAMADRGEFAEGVSPGILATQTLALMQGGLLLSQVRRDAEQMRIATAAVLALIRSAMRPEAREAA